MISKEGVEHLTDKKVGAYCYVIRRPHKEEIQPAALKKYTGGTPVLRRVDTRSTPTNNYLFFTNLIGKLLNCILLTLVARNCTLYAVRYTLIKYYRLI